MRPALLLAPLALSALFFSPAVLANDHRAARAGTITIEGRGEVSGTPDTAFINSGVTTQGTTAREALDANSATMSELIETLKAAGIEARDIQTSNFSVSPNYTYTDQRDEQGYQLPPRIDGYTVSNSVSVRVRDITALGRVLDQAVTVGANTIHGISFSVDDPSELYDAARREAFADAESKASVYMDAAGLSLGPIRAISEGQSSAPPQPFMRTMAMDSAASSVPVEAGELSFAISVSVTWGLDD